MKYGVAFATIASLLFTSALLNGGWYLLMIWPAISFIIIALGYFRFGPVVYGKSSRGVLSPITQVLLLPYLFYVWTVWYAIRFVRREPAINQLTNSLYIGRRLLSHELPDNIEHVIDLTCEFSEPNVFRISTTYHLYPILDGFVPSPEQLHQWVCEVASLTGKVFLHCAEGHGRTGLFAAALLLVTGHSKTPVEALQFIKSRRPLVHLSRQQLAVLDTMYETKQQ